MADSLMCWAASSSNLISWWMEQNPVTMNEIRLKEEQNGTVIMPREDPWTVYRTVFRNDGASPEYALNWWVNGGTGSYDGCKDSTFEYGKENSFWWYGGFLYQQDAANPTACYNYYDTSLHRIRIGQNTNHTNGIGLTLNIIDAMSSGYALSLSLYSEAGNYQLAHAYTLWGLEYEGTGDDRRITRMWVTDSDDGVTQLVEFSIYTKENSIAFSTGAEIRYADGLWTTPYMPEPTTATLSLLALAGLVTRRRR